MRRAAVALLALTACAPEPTEILLVVDSDLSVPRELDALHVEASGDGSPHALARDYDLTKPANALPLSLGLVPSGDTGPALHVVVSGTRGGALVATAAQSISFVAHETRTLELRLGARADGGGGDGGPTDGGAGDGDAGPSDAGADAIEARDADVPGDASAEAPPRPTLVTSSPSDTPTRGPDSTSPTTRDACAGGSILVGFDFSVSQDILTGVRARCGLPRVGVDGVSIAIAPTETRPWLGADASGGVSALCPTDEAVVGFAARHGALLDQLVLRCAPLSLREGLVAWNADETTTLAPAGGPGGNPDPITDCAAGGVAVGAEVQAGDFLERFGLACATLTAR
ncbi:MAG TPA: hypothetical protein VHJ20_02675 [Polyangia bacterium]|nr:hypothetical protein [Polyangia bacterium]